MTGNFTYRRFTLLPLTRFTRLVCLHLARDEQHLQAYITAYDPGSKARATAGVAVIRGKVYVHGMQDVLASLH